MIRSISKMDIILYHIRESIKEILKDEADELHAFFHMSVANEMLYERKRRTGATISGDWERVFSSKAWIERFRQRNDLYNWMKHDNATNEEARSIDFDVRFIVETCLLAVLLRYETMFDEYDPIFFDYLSMFTQKHGEAAGVRPAKMGELFREHGTEVTFNADMAAR